MKDQLVVLLKERRDELVKAFVDADYSKPYAEITKTVEQAELITALLNLMGEK